MRHEAAHREQVIMARKAVAKESQSYPMTISEAKQCSIMKAAREIFLTQGFARAGMAEIARVADVSTATLYKHFISKEQLFLDVVRECYNDVNAESQAANLSDDSSAEDALFAIARDFVRLHHQEQVNLLFRAVIAEQPAHPDLAREVFENGPARRYDSMKQILDGLVKRGELVKHDTASGARMFAGMLRELTAWDELFLGAQKLPRNMDKVLREVVSVYLARYGS